MYSVSNPNCKIWFFDKKSLHNNATEMCYTTMEQEFCKLLELVQLNRLRSLIKSIGWFN